MFSCSIAPRAWPRRSSSPMPPARWQPDAEPVFRTVQAHTGADFEGQLLNRQRGEQLEGVGVVDGREAVPPQRNTEHNRHCGQLLQPVVELHRSKLHCHTTASRCRVSSLISSLLQQRVCSSSVHRVRMCPRLLSSRPGRLACASQRASRHSTTSWRIRQSRSGFLQMGNYLVQS